MKIRTVDELPITLEKLKQILRYDPISGLWIYLKSRGRCKAGSIAGTLATNGYILIYIDGIPYMAHRLAWFYMTGEWPKEEIDHKNNIRDSNEWENLREATRVENIANSPKFSTNNSGYKGVYYHNGKYEAAITFNNERLYLGSFDTPQKASEAYIAKSKELNGEFVHKSLEAPPAVER